MLGLKDDLPSYRHYQVQEERMKMGMCLIRIIRTLVGIGRLSNFGS